jgi:5-methylthioadenosine/S-adenosylhomocysteine deaminase
MPGGARRRSARPTLRLRVRKLEPKVRPAVGPHAVYRLGKVVVAGYAAEEIPIHVHLSETEKEVVDAEKTWGMRPPLLLDKCGILTPRTVAAHCCWLSREECSLLSRRGVHASHNPVSNMKLAVNRAMPYPWLREEGVNVALGTDGCASNNTLDIFREMKRRPPPGSSPTTQRLCSRQVRRCTWQPRPGRRSGSGAGRLFRRTGRPDPD